MSRSLYMLIIGLVILFGLIFLFSTMASDQAVKPMTAEVTGKVITPSESAPKTQ